MESSLPTPADAAAALASVDSSRDQIARDLRLPSHFHVVLGSSIVVQIATAAIGAAEQTVTGLVIAGIGALVFLAGAAQQLMAFRRLNGVWLGGLASRVVFGTGATASTVYAGSLAAAVWAAFSGAWWLVALASIAGGAGYALAGIGWMCSYREDPVRQSRGEAAWALGMLAIPVVAGAVLLVANR